MSLHTVFAVGSPDLRETVTLLVEGDASTLSIYNGTLSHPMQVFSHVIHRPRTYVHVNSMTQITYQSSHVVIPGISRNYAEQTTAADNCLLHPRCRLDDISALPFWLCCKSSASHTRLSTSHSLRFTSG